MAKKKMSGAELKSKCEAMGIDLSSIPWNKIGDVLRVLADLIEKYAPKSAKAGCEDDHASLREALVNSMKVSCALSCHLEECCEDEEETSDDSPE